MSMPPPHPSIPMPAIRDPEAAARFRDALSLHRSVLTTEEIIAKRYIAVKLSDGSSDGTAYETRDDAARNQLWPQRCLFFQVPLERLNLNACDSILWYARKVYDAGYRAEVGGPALIIPNQDEFLKGGVTR